MSDFPLTRILEVPDKNAEIERRIVEADQVLEQCRQRAIDPVEALRQAIKDHDREREHDLQAVRQTVPG